MSDTIVLEESGSAGAATTPPTLVSSLEPMVADILLRSRNTLLEILEDRGYDTKVYRNIAPEQILTLAEGHPRALDIFVPKREDSSAPCDRAVVVYSLQTRIKLRLASYIEELFDLFKGTPSEVKKTDDIIIILNEPYQDAFDKEALRQWQILKRRVTFFHIKQVVVHLGRHVLVPPHRKLSPEESRAEMDRLHLTQKSQLPIIKHHDIQARLLGLVPGDIVEILRPSPTAGIARQLRICAA